MREDGGFGYALRRSLPCLLASVAALAAPAYPANLLVTPEIGLETSWDSNVFNATGDERSDIIFRGIPRITLTLEMLRTALSVSGGFEMEKYARHGELDREEAAKVLNVAAADPLRLSPRFSLRPTARFIESRDAVRRNTIAGDDVPGVAPSETLVTERTAVREYSGSLQAGYLLTPNIDLGLTGGGTRRDYIGGAQGLVDSRTVTGNGSGNWRITPSLSTGLFLGTSYNSFDNRPGSRTYSGGLSLRYQVTEHYAITTQAGGTMLRQYPGAGGQTSDEWFPYGRASLSYAGQGFHATLSGSHEIAGGGSFGQSTRRTETRAAISHAFARHWGWDLAGRYQVNRSTDPAVAENLESVDGSAGIRYTAAEWAYLRLSGSVFRQRTHGLLGDNVRRESIVLGLTLRNTYRII